MSLFRRFFFRKPPDGLLEISERVYVFDCCFSTDVLEEDDYKVYMKGIVAQLRDQFPDASFMVFNFREGDRQSQIFDILSKYDMTVMEYPRHYEGCPLLAMEVIHHFLRSCESWLSLGPHNLLLMHCERGGWPVLAFMLAGLLIYRKQYSGEHKILDMIYKQAPRELLHLLSPLNPAPSQLRYLQYISRRNVGSGWPPLDRALTLDCVMLRFIPNFDGEGGCRPMFRIYGQDPFAVADTTPKVLFSTPRKSKSIRLYRQLDCELVKIDIRCHIQGDVVLECIDLNEDLEREEMMFRVMFNTAFIRSNILMLNRDEIDILWDAKDRFPKDFRAEVLLSDMDAAASLITMDDCSVEEKEGLPIEAFAKVKEIFNNADWLDAKTDAARYVLQQIAASTASLEKLGTGPPTNAETVALQQESNPGTFEGRAKYEVSENKSMISTSLALNNQNSSFPEPTPDSNTTKQEVESQEVPVALQRPSHLKIISQRIPSSYLSSPVSYNDSLQGSPLAISRYSCAPSPVGITVLLHDDAAYRKADVTPLVMMPLPSPSVSDSIGSCLPEHAKPSIISSPTTPLICSTTRIASALPPPPPPLPPGLDSQSLSTSKPLSALPLSHFGTSSPGTGLSTLVPPPPPPPPLCTRTTSACTLGPAVKKNVSSPPPLPSPTTTSASPPTPHPMKKLAVTAAPPPPPLPPLRSRPAPPAPNAPALAPPPPPPPPTPLASKPCDASASKNPPLAPPLPPSTLGGHANFTQGLSKGPDAELPQSSPAVSKEAGTVARPPPPAAGIGTAFSSPLGNKGWGLMRSANPRNTLSSHSTSKKASLKPLHWVKVTRAMKGSLWAESQKYNEASKTPEIDMSELENLFSVVVPKSDLGSSGGKSSRRASLGSKSNRVCLIDLKRAYNCEIMLSKIKMPLPDLRSLLLALDDSALDVDQVDNLIKFCPTKEEIELLKGYNGDKENLGKCEQFFLELMLVPRAESKLRVFSFKIQFHAQVSDLCNSLNIINSAAEEIRKSGKLKRIMQTILSLGNALNQGTARGSAIGFRLDSLLKLTDTRARNNKMTLMHYLCKVLAEKLPEVTDFHKDLVSLEAASKMQLKYLAEEMQAINKGLEKVEEELTESENDGPISDHFRKTLKEFLVVAEAEVRSLASLYSAVGRNADALAIYFGEDPARCTFEQVVSTLLNFVRLFCRAHEENCRQLELERKRAQKEADIEKKKIGAAKKEMEYMPRPPLQSGNIK